MTARSATALARTVEWPMASTSWTMRRAPSIRLATSVSRPAMKSWRARSAGRTARDATRTCVFFLGLPTQTGQPDPQAGHRTQAPRAWVARTGGQACRILSGAGTDACDVRGTGGVLFCQFVFQGGFLESQVVAGQRVLLIQNLLGTRQLNSYVGRLVHDNTGRSCHGQHVLPCSALSDDDSHAGQWWCPSSPSPCPPAWRMKTWSLLA